MITDIFATLLDFKCWLIKKECIRQGSKVKTIELNGSCRQGSVGSIQCRDHHHRARRRFYPFGWRLSWPLRGVLAAVGVGCLHNTSGNANTVLVASGVINTSRGPDAPGTINAVGASDQVLARELQVAILHCPSLALGVLGSGLSTSGVSDIALTFSSISFVVIHWEERNRTHAGGVNVDLLRSGRLVIEVKGAVNDIESGVLLLGTGAAGAGIGQTSKDAALGGIKCSVLDTATRVNGDNTEGLVRLGRGGGRDSGADRGGEDDVLELHFEGESVDLRIDL